MTTTRNTETQVFTTLESNVRSYARSFPAVISYARGTELRDVHGKRYLDFLAGAGSLNYGHNNPVFKQALIDYIANDGITHSLDLHTVAKERFLLAMHEIILKPRGLGDYVMQFTGPTGTNAVEATLRPPSPCTVSRITAAGISMPLDGSASIFSNCATVSTPSPK